MAGRVPDEIAFPCKGAMILGHNFDSYENFKRARCKGTENVRKETWRGVLGRLKSAGVPLDRCFFTNAFMGLCQSKDNREYRGRTSQRFRSDCLSFLRCQIVAEVSDAGFPRRRFSRRRFSPGMKSGPVAVR